MDPFGSEGYVFAALMVLAGVAIASEAKGLRWRLYGVLLVVVGGLWILAINTPPPAG